MTAAKHDIDFLMNQARVKLPGASDDGIKLELYDVFREFFSDSNWWTESIPVSVLVGTTEYNIVPNGGQIVRLAGVVDANNVPQPAIMPEIGTIQFRNAYNVAQTMTAVVIKTVTLPVARDMIPLVPSDVLPLWGIGILDGILGKMMQQQGKTFTNLKQGIYHLARFRDAIQRARAAALRRNTFGTQAWIYPQSHRVNSQRGGISAGNDQRFT